jgi:hypothetical protein
MECGTELMNTNSTEYLNVTLSADHDISADPVAFSIVSKGSEPGPVWTSASVYTAGVAKLLVGPASPYGQLTAGIYDIYVKITDNPEVPVLLAGQLRIT